MATLHTCPECGGSRWKRYALVTDECNVESEYDANGCLQESTDTDISEGTALYSYECKKCGYTWGDKLLKVELPVGNEPSDDDDDEDDTDECDDNATNPCPLCKAKREKEEVQD